MNRYYSKIATGTSCNPQMAAALNFHDMEIPMTPRWPETLWLVRHGQSAGNVAHDAAYAEGAERIMLDHRDVDVPLSDLGEEQAFALGRWFAAHEEGKRPDVMLASPYRRAVQTAEIFRKAGGCAPDEEICIDERLREKEFGILDGLTRLGIEASHPEQAEFRRLLGKFYHRPPGGESWCDVILRLRSLLDTISLHYGGRRVMIMAHQVVVLCFRTIIENLNEEEILAIDSQADVANCAITEYRFDPRVGRNGNLALTQYNITAPMKNKVPVTDDPDAMVAARG